MKEAIKRTYNRIRIWVLEHFTNRVQRIVINDKTTGKDHEVVVERQVEKVCDHKELREIAPTMWKCMGCDDSYFQIGYKVMLTEQDLIRYLDKLATHLKMNLE